MALAGRDGGLPARAPLWHHAGMTDPTPEILVDASGLARRLKAFAAARAWGQFHSPKNLVMALSNEVGELTEIFQWLTEEQSRHVLDTPQGVAAVASELADVLFYFVRLADELGVDLNQAAQSKLAINEARYPADKVYGTNKKYDQL